MNADFPRILTLLRKERGISQKQAAVSLGISQALLSHYEKGIRECGLDFLVRCANFYGVSCDYLLGRSPERNGSQLTVEDIPDADAITKENGQRGGLIPLLNKKLISNSVNILYDLLSKQSNKSLTGEVSSFLMMAVYRMFRVVYSANPKNQSGMFTVSPQVAQHYASACMQICEGNANIAAQQIAGGQPEELYLTTEILSKEYPLFSASLLNLIQNSELRIKKHTNNK